MEGGVLRVEEPDSKPKNFHLSKQAGERHGNSESNSQRAAARSQHTDPPFLLQLKGQSNKAHKSSRRHFNANHELE